jgi:hypothetical protein
MIIIKNIIFTRKLRQKGIYYIVYLVIYYSLRDPRVRSL